MKLSFASLAVIGAALSGLATAEECALDHLQMIMSDANLATCTADSGLSLTGASSFSADQVMKVCASSACMALVADVEAMGLGDCTLPNSTVALQSGVLDPITAVCGGSGSMDMNMSSSSGTSVGDSSTVGSTASDNTVGGSGSTSTSSAVTLTIGSVSVMAMAVVSALF